MIIIIPTGYYSAMLHRNIRHRRARNFVIRRLGSRFDNRNELNTSEYNINAIFPPMNTFSDDVGSSADNNDCVNTNFNKKEKLASWAIATKQTRPAVNMLLKILRDEDPTLPADYRSLCGTPRMSNIIDMGNGKYLHIGLKKSLTNFFLNHRAPLSDRIIIDLNIDGVPVGASSSFSLWPILINIVEFSSVLLVGSYFGRTKPGKINSYLQYFIEDLLDCINNGLELFGQIFHVAIRCVVADAPARAMFLNIISYNGYNSCHKCKIKGVHVLGRVTFPGTENELRTNTEFRNKVDLKHHLNKEPVIFEQILSFDFVNNVVIDYMHAVLLGVTRRLLKLWVFTRGKCHSLKKQQIGQLSAAIEEISSQMPKEFTRKARSLSDLRRYKATELRQLLLYILPAALQHMFVNNNIYEHLLKLVCAIRILCDPKLCILHNNVAQLLLKSFVNDFSIIYGRHTNSFNLHSLLHLCKDVVNMGTSLDNYSAFKFENFLQVLKNTAKTGYKVLEQINNRYAEKQAFDNILQSNEFKKQPVLNKQDPDGGLRNVTFNDYYYSARQPDNFISLQDINKIVKITKIYEFNKDVLVFDGMAIINTMPIFETPLQSDKVGMLKANNEVAFDTERKYEVAISHIRKVVKFDYNNTCFLIKILH